MRFAVAALATVCAFAFGANAAHFNTALFSEEVPSEAQLQDMFTAYMKQFNKAYSHDQFFARYNQFKSNVEVIRVHNVYSNESYTLGINAFADLSLEEFSSKYLGYKSGLRNGAIHEEVEAAPDSIDWRTYNYVTPVKDQGQCGSCWAFSTTGSIEGQWAKAGNKLTSFSEQELVDCDTSYNQGCNGGLMDYAFQWVEKNGLCTEDTYKYTAKDGTCKKSQCTAVAKISSYKDVTANSESSLENAVGTIGPVSVAIEADQTGFQLYSGGIFTGTCGTALDHGVLVVGYGAQGSTNYWIVKNSWGASWGESGYIRLQKDITAKQGKCGIAMEPSYPIV